MQNETYGTRDLSYSAWHRAASVRRFIGWERAQLLTMCDADAVLWLEYAPGSKEPLALIEAAIDVQQEHKPATAIAGLARKARIPAYVVLYDRAQNSNPADNRWRDVRGFRIKRLWPKPEAHWRHVTPAQWATALLRIRAWTAQRLDMEAANDPYWEQTPQQEQLFELG
jgi:hypothetical protein